AGRPAAMRRRDWPASSSSSSWAPIPTSSACRSRRRSRCSRAKAIRCISAGSAPSRRQTTDGQTTERDGARQIAGERIPLPSSVVCLPSSERRAALNLALWLERAGRSHGERPAVGYGARVRWRYGKLAARAARLAGALRHRFGLAAGERVAIIAKNMPEYVELMFGIWHAGLAVVPVHAKLHGRECAFILEHSGARVCFVSAGLDGEIAAHAPQNLQQLVIIGSAEYAALLDAEPLPCAQARGDDLAWLFYTSGTTGRPKGAMLTHRVLATAAHAYLSEVEATEPGDSLLHAAPMSHGSGLYMIPALARLGVNIVPESAGFEPEEIFALLEAWPRTSMFAAPTMVKRLVDCPADCRPEQLRTVVWGGAPMYVEDTKKALERFGPRLAPIYGPGP